MLSLLKETIPHFGEAFGIGGLFGGINDKLSEGLYHIVPREQMDWMKGNSHLSNLGIAWITVKFTEPVRLGVSCLLTRKIAGLFRNGRGDDDLRPSV